MSYTERVTVRDGITTVTRLIRVRQAAPGVWVPDESGTHEVPVVSPPGPHDNGCACMWCQYVFSGLRAHAHQAAVRAQTRFRAGAYDRAVREYLGTPGTWQAPAMLHGAAWDLAGTGWGVTLPAGVTGPAVSAGYGPPAGELPWLPAEAVRAAFKAAKGKPPDVLPERALLAGADPAEMIRASVYEPLALDEAALDRLAPYGKAGPGLCRECLTAAAGTDGLCYYCGLAKQLGARDPVRGCGRADAAIWVPGACGCVSPQDHELARRRVTCLHGPGRGRSREYVSEGACRRCGARVPAREGEGEHLPPAFSRRVRGVLTLAGGLFLFLGAQYSPVWYVLAVLYLVPGIVLPHVSRRKP